MPARPDPPRCPVRCTCRRHHRHTCSWRRETRPRDRCQNTVERCRCRHPYTIHHGLCIDHGGEAPPCRLCFRPILEPPQNRRSHRECARDYVAQNPLAGLLLCDSCGDFLMSYEMSCGTCHTVNRGRLEVLVAQGHQFKTSKEMGNR